MSCIVTASGCGGILSALAADNENDEYVVSSETLAAMEEDYYTIEPIDSDMLSFSDYYDLYSSVNRPDRAIELCL